MSFSSHQSHLLRSSPSSLPLSSERSRAITHRPSALVAAPQSLEPSVRSRAPPEDATSISHSRHKREEGPWIWQTTRGFASSLVGLIRPDNFAWLAATTAVRPDKAELLEGTSQRPSEVGRTNKLVKSEEQDVKTAPPNIRGFLSKVGIMEIRHIRTMASLCSLTYTMPRMTERSLFRRHGLKLVTTSLNYERVLKERPRSVSDVFEEADGMAASPSVVAEAYEALLKSKDNEVPAMQAIVKLKEAEPLDRMPTPVEILGARLGMAAAAAASAANAAASAAASVAAFTAMPLAANISQTLNPISSAALNITAAPMQAVASQLQWAASIGQSTAVATVATVTAALDSAWSNKPVTKRQAISSSYWFVADDAKAHTRFFAIQGSNNIDHWRINLQFDPVYFEDPSLGLKVHRGFYEASKILYEQLLPMVEEHLASSPFAKIVFTGHSLGGSVATLLMLMFLHRKIVPPLAMGPVYTFGAPSIFCETSPVPAQAEASERQDESSEQPVKPCNGEAVLERMGLNGGAIRNVMMHRDLVPRAFACDYTLVADLLARVSDSFKNLEALHHPERRQMYYWLGRTLILQPDGGHHFVHGNADHPMLPPGPNLFTLRAPWPSSEAVSKLSAVLNNVQTAAGLKQPESRNLGKMRGNRVKGNAAVAEPRRTGAQNTREDGGNINDNGPDRTGGANLGQPVKSVADAIAALMDNPHPLEILGEPGSYGFTGAVSRFHDPGHYYKALGGILRSRSRPWRDKEKGELQLGQATSLQLPQLHRIELPVKTPENPTLSNARSGSSNKNQRLRKSKT